MKWNIYVIEAENFSLTTIKVISNFADEMQFKYLQGAQKEF